MKSEESLFDSYTQALITEISVKKNYLSTFSSICSIYLGGGTPSQLPIEHLRRIFEALRVLPISDDAEVTIEINPEDASYQRFQQYKRLGINRASIGVQSLHKLLLRQIGRNHHPQKATEAIELLIDSGIKNISIDLMYDLPSQTKEDFFCSIDLSTSLPITHLSLYNMTIEPKTAFGRKKTEIEKLLPSEEDSYKMLQYACTALQTSGLERYEISAFAKSGYESLHNTRYWQAQPFIGLGPSAFSYFEGARFQNHLNLRRYIEEVNQHLDPIGFYEKLPKEKREREKLAIALRVKKGVQLKDYLIDEETKSAISSLLGNGFLSLSEGRLFLSEKGFDFYDHVASSIV